MGEYNPLSRIRHLGSKKGFTLLEILVVIGIIAILVSLGFASYTTVQKKARDAKRKGDLTTFQKAMEECYSVNSYAYPIVTLSNSNKTISEVCPALGGPSLTITDPSSNQYSVTSSTTSNFSITTQLEDLNVTSFTITNQQ